jgi:hypothetical protein
VKLPRSVLLEYERLHGPNAAQILNRAGKGAIPVTALRYGHTKAGQKALEKMAVWHEQAGLSLPAALCYDRLLQWPYHERKAETKLLFQAAAAYRRAGDKANSDRLVKHLQRLLKDAPVELKELEVKLEKIKIAAADDWVVFRGNAARNGHGPAGVPKVKAQEWARPTIKDRMYLDKPISEDNYTDPCADAEQWLKRALAQHQANKGVLTPGTFPLALGPRAAYRSYCGVTTATLRGFKDGDIVYKPGDIDWKSTQFEGSLGVLLSTENNKNIAPNVGNWLTTYSQAGAHVIVFENEQVGALSADAKFIYAVDDLAVPIPPAFLSKNNRGVTADQYHEDAKPRVHWNNLQAFEIETGKMAWRLGQSFEWRSIDKHDPFYESHFLGAPLPLGGLLYALNEKNDGTLRLVCIDPKKGEALSITPLANVRERYLYDPNRHVRTCHLAYQDGMLVCPTNAGTVLGVDLATQTLRWAYSYRPVGETDPAKLTLTPPTWRGAAPVLHDGAVLVAAPDDDAVHCLDLRDGTPRWRVKGDGEHYLASVHGDRVLLVGKDHCRALALKDGKQLWKLAIDEPTGLGVLAADGLYTLPVRGKAVALWTIDLKKGEVVARQALKQEEPLGNLVIHGGRLLSQSATRVQAFPLAK